ncbi:MAG: DNA polymerase I [Desulfohalobiaceae bacterium]
MALKQDFAWQEEPLYLVDGSSFLYRAFYAYPDLSRSDGFPTNALYITLRVLLKVLRQEEPQYFCFVLDGREPGFRQEILEEYKAQRLKMPEALEEQIPPLLQVLSLLGIYCLQSRDAEADDHIASLCARFKGQRPVVILGSDKDLQQCLDEHVLLWDPGQRNEKVITLADFQAKQGISPAKWPDYQALVGDKSDNIPGVPGIGPKTALQLLQSFPSLEELQDKLHLLPPKQQEKLAPHMDSAFLYRKLTELRTDLEQDRELGDFQRLPVRQQELQEFLRSFEFSSLYPMLQLEPDQGLGKKDEPPSPVQIQKLQGELPDINGQQLGLYPWPKELFNLGLQDREYQVRIQPRELASSLKACRHVFLPNYKQLLNSSGAWQELQQEQIFDLALGAYLLDPEQRDYSWEQLCRAYQGQLQASLETPGLLALELGGILRQQLQQAGLLDLMLLLELPLIPILVRMEKRGVAVDLKALQDFLQQVEDQLQELSKRIQSHAGQEFNPRSTQQLAEVLFSHLGLKPGRKTPGGAPSTSSQVLEGMQQQHPIIQDILRHRSLEKLRSTYLEPLPKLVDHEGRLHTHFNHLATATGRLSSSNPNLQNIPIRGEFGPRMRACFVAGPGRSLVAADYSQIELRILAHMSQDPHLLQAFSQSQDIHATTAALLLDKPQQEVDSEERRKAKTINFGLLYGMGPQKLARELGISLKQAKEFMHKYFSRLQKVSSFYTQVQEKAASQGYITTLMGRRRLLKDINSRNENLAAQAKRLAINTLIQGSAADIIKLAMIQVDADPLLQKLKAELILQVHDELLLEVPREQAPQAGERIAWIMTETTQLSVPLIVEWGSGPNWAQAH